MPIETPLPVTGVIVAANLGDTAAFVSGFTTDGVVSHFTFTVEGDKVSRMQIRE